MYWCGKNKFQIIWCVHLITLKQKLCICTEENQQGKNWSNQSWAKTEFLIQYKDLWLPWLANNTAINL